MFMHLISKASQHQNQSCKNQQRDELCQWQPQLLSNSPHIVQVNGGKRVDPIIRDPKQSLQLQDCTGEPLPQRSQKTTKRLNRIIDMERIFQLIEEFKHYDDDKNQHKRRRTTLADIAAKLQIRYETVRKKHALYKKHGADFFSDDQHNYKNKLAMKLISTTLTKGSKVRNSKEVSDKIEQRYGITYSTNRINKIRRELNEKPIPSQQADFSSICSLQLRLLLKDILSKSYSIYYTWQVPATDTNQSLLVFSSRLQCTIRQIGAQDVVAHVIRQICSEFLDTPTNPYCVIAYLDDIQGDSKDILSQKIKENQFLIEMAIIGAKVILLGGQKRTKNILPQWIQDCYRRKLDMEEENLNSVKNQVNRIKQIVCKGINYFENNLHKSSPY